MQSRPLVGHILQDEALTRGLGDPEARVLIEWLVDRAEQMADSGHAEEVVWKDLHRMCRRARAIGRFVELWCSRGGRGPATQLAASERFDWPLPTRTVDPCDLMQSILRHESGRGCR